MLLTFIFDNSYSEMNFIWKQITAGTDAEIKHMHSSKKKSRKKLLACSFVNFEMMGYRKSLCFNFMIKVNYTDPKNVTRPFKKNEVEQARSSFFGGVDFIIRPTLLPFLASPATIKYQFELLLFHMTWAKWKIKSMIPV